MRNADPAMGDLGYARNEHDLYATIDEWVSEAGAAQAEHCLTRSDFRRPMVWEPACGEGHMTRVLERCGFAVYSTDLIDRGWAGQDETTDFFGWNAMPIGADGIVTNPPYGEIAERFARHAVRIAAEKEAYVCLLLRNEWDSAVGRRDLFSSQYGFARKTVLTKRPRWVADSKGSPRHNYSWFTWDPLYKGVEPEITYWNPTHDSHTYT